MYNPRNAAVQSYGKGLTTMALPHIRTDDMTVRAQQWARFGLLTSGMLDIRDRVSALRRAIAAHEDAVTCEWQLSDCDMEVIRILKKRITSRVDALKLATDTLSSIQSELESLQTALDDNYERTE